MRMLLFLMFLLIAGLAKDPVKQYGMPLKKSAIIAQIQSQPADEWEGIAEWSVEGGPGSCFRFRTQEHCDVTELQSIVQVKSIGFKRARNRWIGQETGTRLFPSHHFW